MAAAAAEHAENGDAEEHTA